MSTHTCSRLIVGLDVHKDTIMACTFDPATSEIGKARQFKNSPDGLAKFVRGLQSPGVELHVCYEASSCGYVIYRQMAEMGVACDVIAPTSIPRRAGDRVKTDRRDAENLATMYAGSLLETVGVPDKELEQVRALVRCRNTLKEDLTRIKHRTTRLLETRGHVFREGKNWSKRFWTWLREIELEGSDRIVLQAWVDMIGYLEGQIQAVDAQLKVEAESDRFRDTVKVLGAFRGVATLTALTLATELGDIRRFASPRELMAYMGLVPSEYSSGNTTRRGAITKTGNAHARRALVTAAWKYAVSPYRSEPLKKRQEGVPPPVIAIAWKAQRRLHKRFQALAVRKPRSVANVAVARELAGFLWAALQHNESKAAKAA
jgi:transposase